MITKFKTYVLTLKYVNYKNLEILIKVLIYINLVSIFVVW